MCHKEYLVIAITLTKCALILNLFVLTATTDATPFLIKSFLSQWSLTQPLLFCINYFNLFLFLFFVSLFMAFFLKLVLSGQKQMTHFKRIYSVNSTDIYLKLFTLLIQIFDLYFRLYTSSCICIMTDQFPLTLNPVPYPVRPMGSKLT